MISDEFLLNLSSFHQKGNKNNLNEYCKISKKMLYKKYTFGKYSSQRYFINCIIFNFKCRLTHLFKEFLLLDNTTEFLRHCYSSHDIKNILTKILEIYCLYSKIYPNYIILKENKFLYKNIRKKQKMIDEKNDNNNKKRNKEVINNKQNELFTLSVRNEIKEFEDNSYNNISINNNKKNNDRYNQYYQFTQYEQKSINTKKINDNWALISNSDQSKKDDSKKSNSKNNHFKNMSFDSFWTNDTNNLSILLNEINDQNNTKGKNTIKTKKKFINSHSKITYQKLSNNTNHNIMEVKSSCKIKSHKKLLYKKIENKKYSNDISRNNFNKTKSKKTYINQLGNMNNINNINIKKPISASVSNSKSLAYGLVNKSSKIINYLFTEKNLNKNLYHCYSIERDNSENTLKKLNSQIINQNKIYHKNLSKENQSSKKFKEKKLNSNNKNKFYNNFTRYKTYNNEHLKTVLDESKKKFKKEKSKEQNSYNTSNNNANVIRNRKIVLKRYFTNKNFRKNLNQMYINNLTESYSQTIINCKRLDSSCNETNKSSKIRSLNACHTASNYFNLKHKNMGIFDKKKISKKQKRDKILHARDIILKDRLGTSYIQKKFFSPILFRRYSLSKSCHIKEDKIKNNKKNNVKLIHRQMMNSEAENKLIDIKNNIKTQIIQYENNDERKYTKSINKLSDINNLIIDFSKENRNSSNKLTTKENRYNKKVYLKKNFSPTLTYFNLYKSGQSDLAHSQNNLINNSDFIEFHHENLFIKNKNSIKIKESNNNYYQNKENILSISNQKKVSLKKVFNITKTKTEYSNFLKKHNNYINANNNSHKTDINKNFILKRIKKNNTNFILSKDEKRTKSNISNIHDFGFQRFNNLSRSTINNNSNYNEFTINKNINHSLSNSMNNLTEFQTPLIQKKRLNLIKKFIYQEEKERHEPFYNNKKLSNKMAIKVNRAKFLERVKEKMKNKK